LLVVGFTALVVRQVDQASRRSNEEHVEQLLRAVTYQLDTAMAGIQQTMRHSAGGIRESGTAQKFVELAAEGRLSTHLLKYFFFVDTQGRIVASATGGDETSLQFEMSGREDLRAQIEASATEIRIGRPMWVGSPSTEVIPVSYIVSDVDGQPMGALIAMIDVPVLEQIWVDIGFRPEDRIELIGTDNIVWINWSQAPGPAAAGRRSWSRPIPGWPIQVVATLDPATVDRQTIEAKVQIAASAVIGVMLIGLFCLLLVRRARQAAAAYETANSMQTRLVATLDAVPVEFIEFDRNKRMILANRAARQSQAWNGDPTGKTMRELLAETLGPARLKYPEIDWNAWLEERVANLDKVGVFEAARVSGEFGRFYTTDLPGGGRVLVRVDITESKRREVELAAAQTRYRLLFNANSYPMVVIDRESRGILAVNDAAVAQYGWSREEALTMTSDDFYPPQDVPAVMTLRQRDLSNSETQTIPGLRHRTKDGTIIDVELKAREIEWEGRSVVLITIHDVTERNRAARASKAAEEQLRQSQKMEVVGQLTGGIAHDFNNILTVILANADALQEDEENLDPGVAARLDQIAQAVLRASGLTRQLLAFSRKQPLSPKRTDINDLVTATGALLRRALGEQIEIRSVLGEGVWTVNIDRAQLETALVNLCVNARDAMPGGGILQIETRNVTLDEAYATQNADVVAGDYAMLSISDTGSGIAPELIAKVCEPFFTTKGVGKGTGLGLSMVYGFIKQSNGHIQIDSEVGRGTSFKLYLPRSEGVQDKALPRPPPVLQGGSERILVVEDDSQVRTSVVKQLQGLGYTVQEAPDGATALAACAGAIQPCDLLLTDIVMPGSLNGRTLADEVKRRWPLMKIVFMSGYSEEAITHHGRLDAGVRLLSKPFRKDDLAQMVRQALDDPGSGFAVPPTRTSEDQLPGRERI
jgi:PAS domain S-box-containing protein